MSNDIICTGPMCTQGKASVDTMDRTFNVLLGNPLFNRQHFEPIVLALEQSFEEQYSFYSPYIPFNPACCGVKDLGAQADKITNDMLASVGAAQPGTGPGSTAPPISGDTIMNLGMLALGVVIVSNVVPLIRKR